MFSVKAGYVTALIRFVTALLDAAQTSKYKVSMYTKAAEMKLPSMFVDIRHEATHGEMPSLPVLRDATGRALEWLWQDYWSKLDEEVGSDLEDVSSISCHQTGGRATGDDMAEDTEDEIEPWSVIRPLRTVQRLPL